MVLQHEHARRVRATNADGVSPWSQTTPSTPDPTISSPLTEFSGDANAFVKRQYQDYLGRQPGFGERNTASLALKNGSKDPADIIQGLAVRPDRVDLRHPIIRLYFAYFDRAPDHAGLQ